MTHFAILGPWPGAPYHPRMPLVGMDLKGLKPLMPHGVLVSIPKVSSKGRIWELTELVYLMKGKILELDGLRVVIVATSMESFQFCLTLKAALLDPSGTLSVSHQLMAALFRPVKALANRHRIKPLVVVEKQIEIYFRPQKDVPLDLWSKRIRMLTTPCHGTPKTPKHIIQGTYQKFIDLPTAVKALPAFIPLSFKIFFTGEKACYNPSTYEQPALATCADANLLMTGIHNGALTSIVVYIEAQCLSGYHESSNGGEFGFPVMTHPNLGKPLRVSPTITRSPNKRCFNFGLLPLWRLQLKKGLLIGRSLDRKTRISAADLLATLEVGEWGSEAPIWTNVQNRERFLKDPRPLVLNMVSEDPLTYVTLALERGFGSIEDIVTDLQKVQGCYLCTAVEVLKDKLLLVPDSQFTPKFAPSSSEPDGGKLYHPEKAVGIHCGLITEIDFRSAYPSIIIASESISPDNYAIFPMMLKRLLKLRAENNDNKAFKLLANKSYGCLKLMVPELGSEVTLRGRNLLTGCINHIDSKQRRFKVIYGVTDSLFVKHLQPDATQEELLAHTKEFLGGLMQIEIKKTFEAMVMMPQSLSYYGILSGSGTLVCSNLPHMSKDSPLVCKSLGDALMNNLKTDFLVPAMEFLDPLEEEGMATESDNLKAFLTTCTTQIFKGLRNLCTLSREDLATWLVSSANINPENFWPPFHDIEKAPGDIQSTITRMCCRGERPNLDSETLTGLVEFKVMGRVFKETKDYFVALGDRASFDPMELWHSKLRKVVLTPLAPLCKDTKALERMLDDVYSKLLDKKKT